MIHPHSDQHTMSVWQRRAFSPYGHLVNAPVSPLDLSTSALIAQHYPGSPPVVDGEVITSTAVIPAARHNTTTTAWPLDEPKRGWLRRAIDDPYWILLTLTTALGLSIITTVVYGVIQLTLAVMHWFTTHGTTIATITILIIALILGGGATAAKCTGIHCGGCRG